MDERAENPEPSEGGGIDRRKLMRGAGMAAAAAWVVPAVLSLDASPAMASGRIRQASGGNESITPTTDITVTMQGLGVLVAQVTLNSHNKTITPPAGWSTTPLYQSGTTSGSPALTVAVFTHYYATDAGSVPLNFSWVGACENALTITGMWGATTVEYFTSSGLVTGSTVVTAPAITVGDAGGNPLLYRQVLWLGGVSQTADDVPAFTPPLSSLQTQRNDFVSNVQRRASYPTPSPSFPATSGSLASAVPYVAGMVTVY